MEKQLLYIDEKSCHFSDDSVDIYKFHRSDLKLDKKVERSWYLLH